MKNRKFLISISKSQGREVWVKAVLPGGVLIINKINKKTGISISQNMLFLEVYDLLCYATPHICQKNVCEISQEFILLIKSVSYVLRVVDAWSADA